MEGLVAVKHLNATLLSNIHTYSLQYRSASILSLASLSNIIKEAQTNIKSPLRGTSTKLNIK